MRALMLRTVVSNLVIAALLFLPAGTPAWPQAWIFLALFNAGGGAIGIWLAKTDPALLAERMKSPLARGQTLRDRAVMAALFPVLGGWLVLMGLDRRGHWSQAPVAVQALGALLIVGAFAGWAAVLRANTFAGPQIRLQRERGQHVVDHGPYAVIRHPMYAFCVPLLVGAPLLTDALSGLVVLVVVLPLLAARIRGEEAQLRAGLPDYPAYAARVRFRLLPSVW